MATTGATRAEGVGALGGAAAKCTVGGVAAARRAAVGALDGLAAARRGAVGALCGLAAARSAVAGVVGARRGAVGALCGLAATRNAVAGVVGVFAARKGGVGPRAAAAVTTRFAVVGALAERRVGRLSVLAFARAPLAVARPRVEAAPALGLAGTGGRPRWAPDRGAGPFAERLLATTLSGWMRLAALRGEDFDLGLTA